MKFIWQCAGCFVISAACCWGDEVKQLPADIVVATDGTGDFTTIQAALDSIPLNNAERRVIQLRSGIYREKIRVIPHRITLRGENRDAVKIEFRQPRDTYDPAVDRIGFGVVNIQGNDFILENLTVNNSVQQIGPHAFAVFGRGTRTIIQNAVCTSLGADTVSLWDEYGMYYHANCKFTGSVDLLCPRGWCYVLNCSFYEHKRGSAAIWHDGDADPSEKFVLRNCTFDGVPGFKLGRRHREGQFYLLHCSFSKNMADAPIWRVTYPEEPSQDKPNVWGDRYYYFDCHRAGDEQFDWYADNLHAAPNSPRDEQITPAWTFDGKWNPERTDAPQIVECTRTPNGFALRISEDVTVRGTPVLALADGSAAKYASGSGRRRLEFRSTSTSLPTALDLNGGRIYACRATCQVRDVPGQSLPAQ